MDRAQRPGGAEPGLAGLVLAGGQGRRLGGADKAALVVGGTTLLDRVLAALAGVPEVVVVGSRRPTGREVRWTSEQPPGGGPLAGLEAGLRLVAAPRVVLLAADLPFLDAATVDLLARSALGHDGAFLVDESGREQWLCGVWEAGALRAALGAVAPSGSPLARVLSGLDAVRVSPPTGTPWFDCDTPAELATARIRARPAGPAAG